MILVMEDPLTRCRMTQQISVAVEGGKAASVLGTVDQSASPLDS